MTSQGLFRGSHGDSVNIQAPRLRGKNRAVIDPVSGRSLDFAVVGLAGHEMPRQLVMVLAHEFSPNPVVVVLIGPSPQQLAA